MVFSDLFFLYVFLPAFLVCYLLAGLIDKWIGKSVVVRNAIIVLFSLIFYAWGEPVYVLLMLASVLVNYFAGIGIAGSQGIHRKVALTVGVFNNIFILGLFKYAGFITHELTGLGINVPILDLRLPIGISFYIFQSISYLVDVYRRESPVQRHFGGLLLYVSLFPQLIAGPIVRYGSIAKEITHRRVTASDLADGLFRFLVGLGKKVIFANQLSEISGQLLHDGFGSLTTTGAWVGIAAFTLQIYFDFSGYSDMAIGIGRCLGFHFRENFNHPYCCDSITDFWRRWHISLGSFFRDYVYIPLGGNRRHQPLNILIVWFLTGLWHGASWNFVIWGLYFGLIVMVEKYTLLRFHQRVPRLLLHLYCLLIVVAGWGIFYFDDFHAMQQFFRVSVGQCAAFHDFHTESAIFNYFYLWVAALVFCLPLRRWMEGWFDRLADRHAFLHGSLMLVYRFTASAVLLAVSTALLVGATNNAFIYTRF